LNVTHSDLNPFEETKVATVPIIKEIEKEIPANTVTESIEQTIDDPTTSTKEQINEVVKEEPAIKSSTHDNVIKKYHVIGGAFSIHSNAKKLIIWVRPGVLLIRANDF